MSYNDKETSVQDGSPIELYTFTANGISYRMTTGAEAITVDGDLYEAVAVSRANLEFGSSQRTQAMTITLPASHDFAQLYAKSVPGRRSDLLVQRMHRSDVDAEVIQVFSGGVSAVSYTEKDGTADIAVFPLSGAFSRNVPRYTFSGLCNNVLFDRWCTINPSAFTVSGTVTSVASNIEFDVPGLSGKGDGWADGGYAIFNGDYRLILKQVGNTVKILLPFGDDVTGNSVDVFAGCSHSLNACVLKFSNGINFNGFPFVPTTNPFVTGLG